MATLHNFYTMLALVCLLLFAVIPSARGGLLHRQSGSWRDPEYDDPYYKRPGAPTGGRVAKPIPKTYSIHQSCYDKLPGFNGKPIFSGVVGEAEYMAQRACERTKAAAEGKDNDFLRAFELCMQNEVTDDRTFYRAPNYFMTWNDRRKLRSTELVYAVLGSIGWTWMDITDQVGSHPDVRFMCDNMESWVPSPVEGGANWWNEEHQVLAVNKCGPDTMGITFSTPWTEPGQTPDPNEWRSVVVLCDNVFNTKEHIVDDLYEQGFPKPDPNDPEHQDMDWISKLTSRVILHEWTHTRRYHQDDFYESSAGWQYLTDEDYAADKRVQDADSLANLGLFAVLQDSADEFTTISGSWVLDRDLDYLPPDPEVVEGDLSLMKQYGDLPAVPRLTDRPEIPLRPGEPPYQY